jgi:hypothetical protein
MFVQSIELVGGFTRPIFSIARNFADTQIQPGTSTLFFVNEEGVAVTCKHVAEMMATAEKINLHYSAYKNELRSSAANQEDVIKKYGYTSEHTVQMKTNFFQCFDHIENINIQMHPYLDLAIIRFMGFNQIHYKGHAVFLKDSQQVQPGKFLCRLGYPFPEFNNFRYNSVTDDIEWTQEGLKQSPRFPIEGMVTRILARPEGQFGIEMSTPGLKGQSGGPLFDDRGIIYGMQFATGHLHLGFDIEKAKVRVNNSMKEIADYAFLHLGQCLHVNIIKDFLRQHGVKYYEA